LDLYRCYLKPQTEIDPGTNGEFTGSEEAEIKLIDPEDNVDEIEISRFNRQIKLVPRFLLTLPLH